VIGVSIGYRKKNLILNEFIFLKLLSKLNKLSYRLAPQFAYPTPTDDCWTALNYVLNDKSLNIDRKRIGFMGTSAGELNN
jgi:hypothetical protein